MRSQSEDKNEVYTEPVGKAFKIYFKNPDRPALLSSGKNCLKSIDVISFGSDVEMLSVTNPTMRY